MITNHICTVIRVDDNDNYAVVGRYPCMWQDKEGYQAASYGAERKSESHIYIPDITADVQEGDAVTKKEIGEPVTETEVSGMLSAVIISRNDYGSKSMQHIKVVDFKINTTLKMHRTANQIINDLELQKGGKVQRFIDTEVVRLCDKYTPKRDGNLKKALGTVYGSGKVKYNVPYARSNYYFNKGRGKGGTAYGGFRGRLWFERMKAAMGDALAESIRRVAKAAKAIWHG